MALVLRMLYQSYSNTVDKYEDSHLENYFLLGSPLKILALSAVYWMFVNKWGPKFMEHRPPYDMKMSMLVYNLLQVAANVYVGCLATRNLFSPEYVNWGCNYIHTQRLSAMCYMYFMLKVVDYTDTVFMVLRKCNKQISFLHVYHHILMVMGVYGTARFNGCGCMFMLGYVNLWVHAVMYTYYFLTAFRPDMKASLWWKKHLTQLQIVQFIFLSAHFAHKLIRADCDKPIVVLTFIFLQNIFMLFMFGDFYIKAYVQKPKRKEIKQ